MANLLIDGLLTAFRIISVTAAGKHRVLQAQRPDRVAGFQAVRVSAS